MSKVSRSSRAIISSRRIVGGCYRGCTLVPCKPRGARAGWSSPRAQTIGSRWRARGFASAVRVKKCSWSGRARLPPQSSCDAPRSTREARSVGIAPRRRGSQPRSRRARSPQAVACRWVASSRRRSSRACSTSSARTATSGALRAPGADRDSRERWRRCSKRCARRSSSRSASRRSRPSSRVSSRPTTPRSRPRGSPIARRSSGSRPRPCGPRIVRPGSICRSCCSTCPRRAPHCAHCSRRWSRARPRFSPRCPRATRARSPRSKPCSVSPPSASIAATSRPRCARSSATCSARARPSAASPTTPWRCSPRPARAASASRSRAGSMPRRAAEFRSTASRCCCARPTPTARFSPRRCAVRASPRTSRAARGAPIRAGGRCSHCSPAPRRTTPHAGSRNISRSARFRCARRAAIRRPRCRPASAGCRPTRSSSRRASPLRASRRSGSPMPSPTPRRAAAAFPRHGAGSGCSSKRR